MVHFSSLESPSHPMCGITDHPSSLLCFCRDFIRGKVSVFRLLLILQKQIYQTQRRNFCPQTTEERCHILVYFLIWIQFHFHFSSPITFPFTHYSLPSRIGATILSAITHICNFECCISASSLSNPILRVGCFASMCYSPLKPKPIPHTCYFEGCVSASSLSRPISSLAEVHPAVLQRFLS